MDRRKAEPDRILRVSGHEFRIYSVYDAEDGVYRREYPDFLERPLYTAEGRPFAFAAQEGCPFGRHYEDGAKQPYECNECRLFHLEAPADPIGVCLCEGRRVPDAGEQKEETK